MTLSEARIALGWTQQRLEAESGVLRQTISAIERGSFERVSYESIAKLVQCLQRAGMKGLSAEALFPISTDRTAK